MYNTFLSIAAADSCEYAKENANFVCSGKNDEKLIQQVIDICQRDNRNIYMYNGTYNIDSFSQREDGGPDCALCFPNNHHEMALIGQSNGYDKTDGVRFYVSSEALASIENENTSVIRTTWTDRGISNGSALIINNISILISHNQTSICAIDLRRCDRPELKNIRMNAYVDMNAGLGKPPAVPAKGCIGLTMTDGSNNSYSEYTNVAVTGFYEGIRVGGEHVVMINCSTIMCCYGYTFGNYEINCGANHPITMINCCDERNINLPLFNKCGDDDGCGGRKQGGQEVTMISFNVERMAEQTPGGILGDCMKEVYPGTWCGSIDFTAQPAWCHTNEIDFKLWEEDGSGTGFKTRNICHKMICTTKERMSYYPTHGQMIFDTDVNKMLVCIDVKNRKWVDFNGNQV